MEWTQAAMDELRRLWCETELSASQIGREMGITKNMVVGKAQRMNLPARQSPINGSARCEQAARVRREKLERAIALKAEGHTGAQIGRAVGMSAWQAGKLLRQAGHQLSGARRRALAVGAALPPLDVPRRRNTLGGQRQPLARGEALAVEPPAQIAAHPLVRHGAGCRWPIGTPRTPGFRFCEAADVVPGKPYCLEHCGIAYVSTERTGGQFVLSRIAGTSA